MFGEKKHLFKKKYPGLVIEDSFFSEMEIKE